MKIGIGDWISIVLVLLVINIMCLWCIDISVSAMINFPFDNVYVTNGWRYSSPLRTYHIGLWGSVLTTSAISLIFIHIITKENKKQ